MSIRPPLQRWKRGDKFRASHLNEAVDIAQIVQSMIIGDGESIIGPDGAAISLSSEERYLDILMVRAERTGGDPGTEFDEPPTWTYDIRTYEQTDPDDNPFAEDVEVLYRPAAPAAFSEGKNNPAIAIKMGDEWFLLSGETSGEIMEVWVPEPGDVLPPPGEQFMVLQLDGTLPTPQPVWDWVRMHPGE